MRCESDVSERLLYQCERYLIPTLAGFTALYRPIGIDAPRAARESASVRGVATGYSGGVDSLYTILRMTGDGAPRAQRLTHLCIFNVGAFDQAEATDAYFSKTAEAARRFAAKLGLTVVPVDSNFRAALPERFLDVYSFRNLAAALALGDS